jgi:hypothetical protein
VFPVLRIRDVYPGSRIRSFPSQIRIISLPDPGSKNSSILTQKIVSKHSELWSGFVHPRSGFIPSRIPDPGVKKIPNPGSGSATLVSLLSALGVYQAPSFWVDANPDPAF